MEEYLANGRNGTRAYMRVYPNASEETARREASTFLTKPDVQKRLAAREAELLADLDINERRAPLLVAKSSVQSYLANGRNATQAYLKFHPKVCTKSAETLGARLLGKVGVATYLAERSEGSEYLVNPKVQAMLAAREGNWPSW